MLETRKISSNNKQQNLELIKRNREQMEKYKTTSAVVDFNMILINNMHQTQRYTKVDGKKKIPHECALQESWSSYINI